MSPKPQFGLNQRKKSITATSISVTDVEDEMSWRQIWNVGDRFNTL